MGHDVEAYDVISGHRSPTATKTVELAQQGASRDAYQRDARQASRQYAGMVGLPDSFVPVLSSISPNTKTAGSATFSVTAYGSNFNEDSKIFFGATELPTVWEPGGIWAMVPASLVASAGTVQVSVKTDSSTSTTKPFTVT